MKELASLVSKHAEKNYTITQYVNDITLANEEVLAELDVKGNVTSTYTYGLDRLSHETKTQSGKKVTENTGYYLYNGLNSVTGIASDTGAVQETYAYDPYGNLTAGEPAQVNFYGYNGESTNTRTGLQYLRARYYDMSNGNFITEDTYAGQTTDPSTLNRYTYVSNNPVNREDPSGHSWFSKVISGAKKMVKDAGNAITKTVKKVADDLVTTGKKVLNTVSETAKKVGNAITNTVNKVIHAVTHPAETLEKVNQVVQETKEKVVSEGKKIVKTVSNKVQNLGETITEAKNYVAIF